MKVCKIMLVAGLSCGLFVAGCEQAKNSAEKATSAAGDAAKKAGEVAPKDPESYYNLARQRLKAGDKNGAVKYIKKGMMTVDNSHHVFNEGSVIIVC